MKKVSLLFVASAIAVGSAYACGGGEPAKNTTDVSSATPSATTTATDTPSATASVTATATATTPPAPEAPPLAIDGVKLTGKKDGKTFTVEVKTDGTVVGIKDGKPLPIGMFVKNELKDEKGTTVFSVAADGKITSALGGAKALAFNDKDEMLVDGKPSLVLGDDGTPSISEGTKTEKPPMKFEKLPPKSKRAALLLLSYLLFASKAAAPPAVVSASAAPSTTAKPPH